MNLFKNIFKEERKKLIFLFLFLSLLLVCLPRFDRADYGPIKYFVGNEELYEGLPYDILIYKNYIEYLRTGAGEEKITPPYAYRILLPFLSSQLPFAPLTSLNLVNFIFLLLGLIFLYLTLIKLKSDFDLTVTGCLMYIYSFPVFYYATSGYIDGTIVGLISAGVYFVVSGKWTFLFTLILTGTMASEKIIILLPFTIVFLFTEKYTFKKIFIIAVIFVLIYIITSYYLRKYAPGTNQPYIWFPDTKFILQNIYRPKTYLSFLLTLGVPGVLAVISYFKFPDEKKKYFLYFYAGCLTSLALFLYSIYSAWADGRTVWTMYPFAIPPAVMYLKFRREKSEV